MRISDWSSDVCSSDLAGAAAEVGGIVLAGVAGAARRGVRHHQHEAELGGDALRTRLHGEVFFRAGEAGEEGDHRDLVAASRLRRLVQGEVHRAVAHLGLMAVETLRPLEAALQIGRTSWRT